MKWFELVTLVGVAVLLITTGLIVNYKWKEHIIRWWKKYRVMKFIVNVFVPFIVPFVLTLILIKQEEYENWNTLFVIILIIWAVVIVNFIFQFKYWKQDRDESLLRWENFASKHAYMGLYRIQKDKKTQYSTSSLEEFKSGTLDDKHIPYDVFEQIRQICLEFSKVIGDITGIPSVHISVSFIYHYTSKDIKEQEWKWIVGRNSKFNGELEEFINQKDSMYHHMIHNKIPFIFYNDKKQAVDEGIFYYSAKDRLHNNSGSIFASKFGFNNNKENCCEGLLMITTYGEKFVKKGSEYSESEFEQLLLDKIFPCYKNLLQAELGMLYFRHKNDQTDKVQTPEETENNNVK